MLAAVLAADMASAVRTRNEHESRLAVQRARDERAKHLVVLMQHHLAQLGYSGALDALVADSGARPGLTSPPVSYTCEPHLGTSELHLCATPCRREYADVRAGGQHRPARGGAGDPTQPNLTSPNLT